MPIDDDEARKLFEQLQKDQTQAGLENIARCAKEFFDAFLKVGFRHEEAFELARDVLAGWLDVGVAVEEGPGEADDE